MNLVICGISTHSYTKYQTQKKSSDLWFPDVGGRGRGNWRKVVKIYKLLVIRLVSTRDIIYKMTIVNSAV